MSKENVSKKSKGKIKKIMAGFMAAVLLVGGTILGTLAFLKTTTNPVTNTFTASSDIKLGLAEPSYDEDRAGNFEPGETYAKDPTLYNLTGGVGTSEEWVAMRVDYMLAGSGSTYSSVPYSSLQMIDRIDFNNTEWIRLTSEQLVACGVGNNSSVNYEIYVYKYKLKEKANITTITLANNTGGLEESNGNNGGGKTKKLFTQVKIKDKNALLNIDGYKDTNNLLVIPSFKIIAKGAAIKHDSTVASTTEIVLEEITDKSKDSHKIVKELVTLLKD